MDSVLVADDVRKSYGDTAALDGVSLAVGAGEVFALVGPNGAGKTTLVRCLTGTTEPDSGSVELLGESPRDARKQRVGLLPQAFSPPERLTARELVSYYAGLYDDAREPEAVLDEVGLDPDGGTWYGDLSGGEKRRACVAAALVNDPDVLFLDEPTSGLDPRAARTVRDTIAHLAEGDATVFLSTHILPVVDELADTVGVLYDGSLVTEGSPGGLKSRAESGEERTLEDVFLEVTGGIGEEA